MRRRLLWSTAAVAAAGVIAAGIAGAYSYGRNYDLHRGFAVPAQLPHAGRGKLLTVHFYSAALHRRADYLVYLPPGYSTRRRYPVYYLLHGMPGDPHHFASISSMNVRLDNLLSLHRVRPMILVYPDGQIGGSQFSDSEWANTSSGNYDSYVIDVVNDVDHRFATKPYRQDRVIAGCSAGAYGAMNLALHHLSYFGGVQSWSGYFIQTKTGVFGHASPASLAYNSPYEYARRLGGALAADPLRAYIMIGRSDSAYRQQQPMIDLLRSEGAQVQYRSYRGGHDWSVWIPHLNQMLEVASRDMSSPPPSRRPRVAAAASPATTGTGRQLTVHFYSAALHRRADYFVYLPPGYSRRQRYPVYYLLHGMPGGPDHFMATANMNARLDTQLALHRTRPMIIVYPDGRIGASQASDSEWANTPSRAYDSYVIDVVKNVDRRFATEPYRQDRVIAGCSAGAYGAMNVGLHHLDYFASIQSWSGYFLQTKTGVFAHASPASLAYNSPLDYAQHLSAAVAATPLRARIIVGRGDPAYSQQAPMVKLLRRDGMKVQYHVYPGGHGWGVWIPHLNQLLDLASYDMTHPLGNHPGATHAGLASARAVGASVAAPPSTGASSRPAAAAHRHHRSQLRLLAALLLALLSAAVINLGFVLQHRGHADGRASLASVARNPSWLLGQAVGWLGFAGQIAAVALAPLTLVQAFSSGSLALSVPLVARLFGHRIGRTQLVAIAVIALSLASLPIGFAGGHGQLRAGWLIGGILLVALIAAMLAPAAGAVRLATVAGLLYGAGDAAIKAAALGLRGHHVAGSTAGWVMLVAVCTFTGFLAFQTALRRGDAVGPLTLMNAFTAITAATFGIAAFGESLGVTPVAAGMHALAIALVLASVRPLASAQQRIIDPGLSHEPSRLPARQFAGPRLSGLPARATRSALTVLLGAAVVMAACVAAIGLLYSFRGPGLFTSGPRVGDALPLLQLAGLDAQPLARTLLASLLTGAALGVLLLRLPWRGIAVAGVLALVTLLFASDASYALAHNLRLVPVLESRSPGAGAWLEGLLLGLGCAAVKALALAAGSRGADAWPRAAGLRLRSHRAASGF